MMMMMIMTVMMMMMTMMVLNVMKVMVMVVIVAVIGDHEETTERPPGHLQETRRPPRLHQDITAKRSHVLADSGHSEHPSPPTPLPNIFPNIQ